MFIRAGTSGALSEAIDKGSVVITTKALRFEGVSDLYVTRRLRAIADHEIVRVLESSAQRLGIKYRSGVTLSTVAFYAMGSMAAYSDKALEPMGIQVLQELKESTPVLNVEMETATLLTLSRIYGMKSGSVCGISNRIPWEEGEQIRHTELALRNSIRVAVEALDNLHQKHS